jgi:hypothetical protein
VTKQILVELKYAFILVGKMTNDQLVEKVVLIY